MKFILPEKARELKKAKDAEFIFEEWLEENFHRFKYKPVKRKSGLYTFKGMIKNICWYLQFNSMESTILFYDDDKLFDMYDMAYVYEKYNPLKGYYDCDRVNKEFDYFSSRKELYINDVLEPSLEYFNKTFVPTSRLFFHSYEWSRWARITNKSNKDDNTTKVFNMFIEK